MVIDIKRLRLKGKRGCSFHFDYEADDALLTLPESSFSGAVSVTGELEVDGEDVFVNGEISYSINTVCSRCLTPTVYEKVVPFDEKFSPSDDEAYPYYKETVDLTDMVNDKIILSLPYAVYCKDDCKGLCPTCGADLNKGQCDCNK